MFDAGRSEPLPGVSVSVKGTSRGTTTDAEGRYRLSVPTGSAVLVFSFIGYTSQEVSLGSRTALDVQLVASDQTLNEVMVVGYGTQRRSDLTGSVSSVSEQEIKAQPISSLDQALQGRAAGVQVTQASAAPGGGLSIRIRGASTLQGGNEPLYVIDGFPVYSDNQSAAPGAVRGGTVAANALASVNPNDIASIEILKDASATAIYGSRGANGVVLITTKRGKAGQGRISFDAYYGSQQVAKQYDVMSATEFVNYANQYAQNIGAPPTFPNPAESYEAQATNWQDEIFRTAPIQNYQLTISGGEQKTQYALSGNYFNQKGVVKNSSFDRFSFRTNIDTKVNDRLSFGNNLLVSRSAYTTVPSEGDYGFGGGAVYAAINADPTMPIYTPDGNFTSNNRNSPLKRGGSLFNPIEFITDVNDQTISNRVLGNVFGNYALLEGLSLRVSVGVDMDDRRRDQYYSRRTRVSRGFDGVAVVGSTQRTSVLNENILTYQKTFNNAHNLTFTAGYTWQNQKYRTLTAGANNFVDDVVRTDNLGAGTTPGIPQSYQSQWVLSSWLGRANYAYNDKYLLTVTARADGSSKFGLGNKWGFFPSAALGWRLGEESFIKNLRVFSDLKLRVSYGITGNQEIGEYNSLAALGTNNYNFNDVVVAGRAAGRLPNPNLRWERTGQFDLGADFSFLAGRINVTADVYQKLTNDLLLQVTLPYTSGFSSQLKNSGSVRNRGLELALNASPLTGPFKWTTSANWSLNRNEVVSLGEGKEFFSPNPLSGQNGVNGSIVRVGAPLGSFYGYQFAGIFQDAAEVTGSAQPNAKPGDARLVDVNNDGKIDAADQTIIGNPNPKYIFGWTNNFAYKGFELSVFLNGVQGNDLANLNSWEQANPNNLRGNKARVLLDAWSETNRGSLIPKPGGTAYGSFFVDRRMLEDGSFVRLKNLTLAYNVPMGRPRLGLRTARLYVSGQNLFTITNYTGFDPEVNTQGQSSIAFGWDVGAYPVARTYLLGINLGF